MHFLKKSNKPEKYPYFLICCKNLELPMPYCDTSTGEVLFAKEMGRIWRTDYLFIAGDKKIAVEIEGGVFDRGGHVRPETYSDNCHKYNCYAMLGYTVLRFTSKQAKENPSWCAQTIKAIIDGTTPPHLFEAIKTTKQANKRAAKKRALKS